MAKGQAIVRLTAETNDYESKIRQAKKTFDGFMKGIGMSPAKFTKLGVAIAATTGAMKVAKDAFMSSEAAVDEWGRTMDSAKSLYQGFLNSINNGDISGFLGRIDQIVAAARTAYNELDRLGTMRTIQKPAISAQQTENERIRMMIQTGRYIAPIDGRAPNHKNGELLSAAEIKTLERQLQGGTNKLVELVGNEVKQTTTAIDAVYAKQGLELGMSIKEFRKGTSSMAEFDKRMKGYELYRQWDAKARTEFAKQGGQGFFNFDKTNPYAAYRRWGNFRVDGDKYNELVGLIAQRDQQAASTYSMQAQALRAINRAEGVTLSKIMGRGGGGGRGGRGGGGGGGNTGNVIDYASDSIEAQEKLVQDLTEKWKKASAELRDGYNQQLTAAKNQLEVMQNPIRKMSEYEGLLQSATMAGAVGGGNFSDKDYMNVGPLKVVGTYQILTQELQTLRDLQEGALTTDEWENYGRAIEATEKKLKVFTGDVGNVYSEMSKAANAIQAVGGALQGIEDPAAKVMGIIAEAIATIALTFAKSLEGTFTPWDWIAGAATGVATMVSTIAAIKSATAGSFAHGGVIGGHSYSGDNQFAMVNAGETILTQAQAGILSSRINGLASQDYVLDAVIDGEKIRLVMNRNSRRRMHGEYVTTKGH